VWTHSRVARCLSIAQNQRTPLHWAGVKNAPEQIVLKLIEVYPDALRQPDEYGHIPLHLALTNHATPGLIDTLLAASPSTLNIKDNSENNILHIAFRAGSILPLASKLIVKAGLEMLQEKNILGETPIEGTNSGNLQVLVKQAETPEGFARLEAQVNAPPGPPKAPWKPPEVS
jgi:hypothetical protein